MTTLKELQEQNEKLRKEIHAKNELVRLKRQENKLLKENKRLLRQTKYPIATSVGRTFGKESKRIGINIGKGLINLGNKIAENQRRVAIQEKKMKDMASRRKKGKKRKNY